MPKTKANVHVLLAHENPAGMPAPQKDRKTLLNMERIFLTALTQEDKLMLLEYHRYLNEVWIPGLSQTGHLIKEHEEFMLRTETALRAIQKTSLLNKEFEVIKKLYIELTQARWEMLEKMRQLELEYNQKMNELQIKLEQSKRELIESCLLFIAQQLDAINPLPSAKQQYLLIRHLRNIHQIKELIQDQNKLSSEITRSCCSQINYALRFLESTGDYSQIPDFQRMKQWSQEQSERTDPICNASSENLEQMIQKLKERLNRFRKEFQPKPAFFSVDSELQTQLASLSDQLEWFSYYVKPIKDKEVLKYLATMMLQLSESNTTSKEQMDALNQNIIQCLPLIKDDALLTYALSKMKESIITPHQILMYLYNHKDMELGETVNGICHGFTMKWLEACILGKEEHFDFRIRQILYWENLLPALIAGVKKNEGKSQRKTQNKTTNKAPKQISDALSDEVLFEIITFFQGIMHYQRPYSLGGNQYLNQLDIEKISQSTSEQEISKQKGLKIIYSECLICTEEEINAYLEELEQEIRTFYHDNQPLGVLLCSTNHTIGLCFQPRIGWKFMDINDYKNSALRTETTKEIAKKIKRGFQNNHPFMVFHSFIITTMNHFKKNIQLYNKENPLDALKKKHPITHNMAQRSAEVGLIWVAAEKGHIEHVNKLIHEKTTLNQSINGGLTPLYIAAQNGHIKCVQALIDAKANINQPNDHGATPLYIAAQNGHIKCVQALIHAKININQPNDHGATPLFVAAQNGHIECLKELIKAGSDTQQATNNGWTPLLIAVEKNHVECIKELIKAHTNINHKMIHGYTPLLLAAHYGHIKCIQALIDAQANINQPNDYGVTPLFIAAQNGHIECVKALVNAQADIHCQEINGWTPLLIASKNGHYECVKALAQAQTDMNY